MADEGEGLEHWTGVSLLGARGASAWAEAAVLPERGCWVGGALRAHGRSGLARPGLRAGRRCRLDPLYAVVELDLLYTGDELELPDELDVDVGDGDAGGAALWLVDGCRCARRGT